MKAIIIGLSLLWLGAQAVAQSGSPDKDSLLEYFQRCQFHEAALYIAPFAAARPGDLHLAATLGYACYEGGDLPGAAACFQRIYQADSTNPTACRYLGAISLAQGNKPRALAYFCRLADLKPGVVSTYRQLAQLWISNVPSSALACKMCLIAVIVISPIGRCIRRMRSRRPASQPALSCCTPHSAGP